MDCAGVRFIWSCIYYQHFFFPLAFASSPTTTAVSEISRLVDT